MSFNYIPGDTIRYNGKVWYVIARSIQDGKSLLLSTRIGPVSYDITTMVPTAENSSYVNVTEQAYHADWKFLAMQDYSMSAMYF